MSGIHTCQVSTHVRYPHMSGNHTCQVTTHVRYPHMSGIQTCQVSTDYESDTLTSLRQVLRELTW